MEKEGIYMYQLNVIDGMGIAGKTRFLNRISQKGWRLTGGNGVVLLLGKGQSWSSMRVVPDRYLRCPGRRPGRKAGNMCAR